MQGLVIKSTGSWYEVLLDDKSMVSARIRGKFRMEGLKVTNPITVGDIVDLEEDKDNYVIYKIHPRRNYIIRKSVNLSKQYHILAANVDQAVLMVSATHPKTYSEFIDRFLLTATAYHIPGVIIINKTDLYGEEENAQLKQWMEVYTAAGYKCIASSVVSGEGIEEIKTLLKDKISVVSGHSGVGKSSLINKIDASLNLKTAIVSEMHEQGKHTTTFAEMHPLVFGGYIIDTPGIKGLGLVDMKKDELCKYFPEFLPYAEQCRFNNCVHINEPGCAVKEAVIRGKIREERYNGYLNIYHEDQEENYR
ncbi:MAG: ribosome small subunit-dependent GTPase A [Flavobacteriales bacterium]